MRRLALVLAVAALLGLPQGMSGATPATGLAVGVPGVLDALSGEGTPTERASAALRAIALSEGVDVAPTAPCPSLDAALRSHAARLGIAVPLVPTLAADVADALGCLLGALDDANRALDATIEGVPSERLVELMDSLDSPDPAALAYFAGRDHRANLAAAIHLLDAVATAMPVLTSPRALASGTGIDLPPILSFQPIGAQTYTANYALIVDVEGDDTYDNHAGGVFIAAGNNIFDVESGTQQTVPGTGHHVAAGGNVQDADITMSSSLVLDLAGSDVYGVRRAPRLKDLTEACGTSDRVPIVGTIGAGIFGLGMVVDSGGDNAFIGRTQSQGAGHVFGVGVLVTGEGDDQFEAIRGAQGSGLLGGIGLLVESGGADTYTLASPQGGVFNGDMHECDDDARYGQGGNFDRKDGPFTPAIGILADLEGSDTYVSDHKSQGFSQGGGFGLLLDVEGDDSYLSGEKAQGAGNGRAIEFSPQAIWSGGIGLLVDLDGDDDYTATTMAQGWALGTGLTEPPPPVDLAEILLFAVQRNEAVGVLMDAAGDDTYVGPLGRDDATHVVDGTLGVFFDAA